MMTTIRHLSALAFALAFSASAWPSDLTGQWDLKIEDRSHHVVTVLVIEFTSQEAQSCIAGNWFRVNVVSAATEEDFYPVSDPLSFHIENDQLTIGRNEVCDGYLMLHGALSGEMARGDYYSLGIDGSSPLGFFTLSKKK